LSLVGNSANRRPINFDEALADEVSGISAGIRRPYNAAMPHAGHTHIMHKDEITGGFVR